MNTFKVGDKVYYPTISTEVLIAVKSGNVNYPIAVRDDGGV